MNRNVGGISFSLSPVLPENRWYARGLYPVPVVGLSPFGTPDNCFTYRESVCLLFLNYALEGIFPEIRPLRIVLISFRVSPFRTFRIDLLYEQDAVLSV